MPYHHFCMATQMKGLVLIVAWHIARRHQSNPGSLHCNGIKGNEKGLHQYNALSNPILHGEGCDIHLQLDTKATTPQLCFAYKQTPFF